MNYCVVFVWGEKLGWPRTLFIILLTFYIFKVKPKTRLLNGLILMSFDLHSTGQNRFHSNLMKTSGYFHLTNFNPDLLDTAKVKHISLMKQEYISYWQHTLQHSQNLEFYRLFKKDHTPCSCLHLTRNTCKRRALRTFARKSPNIDFSIKSLLQLG